MGNCQISKKESQIKFSQQKPNVKDTSIDSFRESSVMRQNQKIQELEYEQQNQQKEKLVENIQEYQKMLKKKKKNSHELEYPDKIEDQVCSYSKCNHQIQNEKLKNSNYEAKKKLARIIKIVMENGKLKKKQKIKFLVGQLNNSRSLSEGVLENNQKNIVEYSQKEFKRKETLEK